MKELIILIGPPGSGKSTFGSSIVDHFRISQDDMGREGHKDIFNKSIAEGRDIVLDRMNFNKQQRANYILKAKESGYKITAHTFFFSHETCYNRMMKRKDHPIVKTSQDALGALHTFYSKFEYATLEEGFDELKETREAPRFDSVVCVDIDGTVANLDHRLHYVRGKKKDWRTFLSKCDQDSPKYNVYNIAEATADATGSHLVFCSGRGNEYRDKTATWLEKHRMLHDGLYMRQERDYRQDTIVKEQILDFEILTRYKNVHSVFDDRSSVVETWRKRGLLCLQVAPGDF